jgi:hypothetical protein
MKEINPNSDNPIKKYKKIFKDQSLPPSSKSRPKEDTDTNPEENTENSTKDKVKNKVDAVATKAAEEAISKGLSSYGVPPVISNKLGKFAGKHVVKYGKKLLMIPIIILLLLIVSILSLFSIASSGAPNIKPSKAAEEIPKPYLEAYIEASAASGIPWTVFAGIGKMQSNHGRVSPYDDIVRSDEGLMATKSKTTNCTPTRGGCVPIKTEGSVYTCSGGSCGVLPIIGEKDGEGKGPYLMNSSILKPNDNPQDIKKAVMYVAEILAKAAEEQSKGLPDTYGYDEKTANAYWLGVVSSLDSVLGNPESNTTDCSTLAAGESVTTKIYVIWRCEILRSKLHLLTDSKLIDNLNPTFSEVRPSLVTKTLISEAYSVAYSYSKWDNSTCSKTAASSGIFPISKAQAKIAVIDRCDDRQNIALAARIVISGESYPIENRSIIPTRYQPLIYGWRNLYGSLGSTDTIDEFLLVGPNSNFRASNSCLMAVNSWLKAVTKNANTALDIGSYNSGADITIGKYINSMPHPINDASCQNNGKLASKKAFNEVLTTESNILFSDLSDGNIEELPGQIKRIEILQNYFGAQQFASSEVVFGVDSSVARLSSTGVKVNYPAPLELTTGSGSDFAKKVINFAITYGGLFEGDERAGASGEPIGIAYLRDMTLQGQIVNEKWSSDFPKVNFSECGYSGNARYISRELLVSMWEDLCQAAKLANVDLYISSAYRDNANQTGLREGDKSKNVVAAPAAKLGNNFWKGGSPHEKGIAIDLPLKKNSLPSYNSSELSQLHFLHDIVGCYSTSTYTYFSFDVAMDYIEYGNGRTKQCDDQEIPIKRVNTFGFAVFCSKDDPATGNQIESPANPGSILCTEGQMNGTNSDGTWVREQWHIQPGQPVIASSPIKDNQGVLDAIHENFPISEWDNAIDVAKKVSGFDEKYSRMSNTEPSYPLVGLFAIPNNAGLKNQYLKLNKLESSDIDNKKLSEWTIKLENNVKLAHQSWLECGWGYWKDVKVKGAIEGCDKAGSTARNKSNVIINGRDLPSQLYFALRQVGKRYLSGSNDNLAFDNTSLIASAYNENDFSGLSGLEIFNLASLTKIPLGSEQKGDLIFINTKNEDKVYVGIVIDPKVGNFVLAIPGSGVTILESYKNGGKYNAQLKGFAQK